MRLIITRHAKSSWDDPSLRDHERPLSKRGRKSSDAIGQWLAENGYIPKVILCSTSKRTTETWQRIKQFMPGTFEIHYETSIYHGHTDAFFAVLAQSIGSPAMLLGHNPGIADFAESILRNPPQHDGFFRYPTAATLICDAPVQHWRDLQPGSAELVDFIVPRELI